MSAEEQPPATEAAVIEAAGGILWRRDGDRAELAVIHRPRHADWSLPKGKRDPGETWQETALREVHEETGCRAVIESFAGGTAYTVKGRPKVVLFWHMVIAEHHPFAPNDEVDELDWLDVEAALERLDYETERDLLRRELAMRDREPPG